MREIYSTSIPHLFGFLLTCFFWAGFGVVVGAMLEAFAGVFA